MGSRENKPEFWQLAHYFHIPAYNPCIRLEVCSMNINEVLFRGVETASHTGHCPINLVNVQ